MTLILIDPLTGKAVEHDIESWGAQCRLDPIDEAAALPEGTVIYTTEEATPSLLSDAELLATLRSVEWVQWDGGVYCPGCFAYHGNGHNGGCRLALTISALERRLDGRLS